MGLSISQTHGAALSSGPDFLRDASADGGTVLEVQVAKTEFQREVIGHAVEERGLRIATAEDLISVQPIADRAKEQIDLSGLSALADLDWPYAERWASEPPLRFASENARAPEAVRYWWVNQNQTYRHEVAGGYLWSPKRKADGHRNPFYEFMREVAPGDLVFSFCDTLIRAIGLARSYAYEAPKPPEFGGAGRKWDEIGWRVDVRFQIMASPIRPADWIEKLRPLLPQRYSPLRPNGHGVQSIYLTELSQHLALELAELVGAEIGALARRELVADGPLDSPNPELVLWEEHLRGNIEQDATLSRTDREALVLARRGQGLFRQRVQEIESRCRITLVDRPEHLRASHCKPWRDSNHEERLTGQNGLLLTPSIDHLFDRGFISFGEGGALLISPVAHKPSLQRMGVAVDRSVDVGTFTNGQARFLEYHRDRVFLRAQVRT